MRLLAFVLVCCGSLAPTSAADLKPGVAPPSSTTSAEARRVARIFDRTGLPARAIGSIGDASVLVARRPNFTVTAFVLPTEKRALAVLRGLGPTVKGERALTQRVGHVVVIVSRTGNEHPVASIPPTVRLVLVALRQAS